MPSMYSTQGPSLALQKKKKKSKNGQRMQGIHSTVDDPLAKGKRSWNTLKPRTLKTLFFVKKDKACDYTYRRDLGEARSEAEHNDVNRGLGREKWGVWV